MVDVAYLGIAVDSSQADKASGSLKQLSGAAKMADAATRGHTTAANNNAVATKHNTAAVKANELALLQQEKAARAAAYRMRIMSFQLNDVFASLAFGMPIQQVAIQQGFQIGEIYGRDGMGAAIEDTSKILRGLFVRLRMITIPLGLVSAGFAGMAYEMRRATGESVGFMDVAKASFVVVRDAIYSVLQPAIAAISPWFSAAWDGVVTVTKAAGNFIVGAMVGATNAVIAAFQNMAAPIGQVFADIQNTVYDATLWVSRRMHELLNPGSDGNMAIPRQAYAENPFAGMGGQDVVGAFTSAFDTDYLGDFYNAVQSQVISQLQVAGEEAGETGKAIKTAMDTKPVDLMGKSLEKANDQMNFASSLIQSFIGDLRSGIQEGQSFWDAFRKAGMNALNRLLDKMIEMATHQLVMAMFGVPMGARGGSMIAPANASGAFGSGFALYQSGGYTGDMPINRPAGVVHGQEFVVNAAATKRNRKALEAMNSGAPMGGGVSVLEVRLDARTEARVLEAAEGQAVRIVRASAPGMAEAGARRAQQSFADQPTRWQR